MCSDRPIQDSHFCYQHHPIQAQVNAEMVVGECTLCCEIVSLTRLNCGHTLHLKCAASMINPECPICRSPLTNVPEEVIRSIRAKQGEFKEECEAEDRQAVLRMVRENDNPNVRVSAAIVAAMQFLRDHGVPMRYIPQGVEVTVEANAPQPNFSNVVLQEVIRRLVVDCVDDSTFCSKCELPRSLSPEESDTNPFEEENAVLATVQRHVAVHVT